MAYRRRTLRRMSPTARKIARLTGELDSVSRRLKNLIPDLQRLDLESQALQNSIKSGSPRIACFRVWFTDGTAILIDHPANDKVGAGIKAWERTDKTAKPSKIEILN